MSGDKPKIVLLEDACCGCGACAAKCPKECIHMLSDGAGFFYPEILTDLCVHCGGCDSVCPVLGARCGDDTVSVSWAKSKDLDIRLASSSGGVFKLLAQDVLSSGGLVAGAAWTKDCRSVNHILIEDESELDDIMRSKYVQSSVSRGVYEGIRDSLRSGRRVLFAGTACQVAGLRAYLGHLADSDCFLAIDVICHGVPSPLLWKKWVEYKERAAHSELRAVNMRSKTTGWLSFSASYAYAYDAEKDGASASPAPESDSCVFSKDWYMKAFLANVCLRPSCYACPVKRSCGSDITLGDFWGVDAVHSEVDCEGGVSAVVCNTDRGGDAFEFVKPYVEWGESSFENVLPGNPSLVASVAPHSKHLDFMRDLEDGMDIKNLSKKYSFEPSFGQKLRFKFGAAWHRILCALGIGCE